MRVLILSPDNRRRLEVAGHWLRREAGGRQVLVCAPTREAIDEFVRCHVLSARGLGGVWRLTPRQLALQIALPRLAGNDQTPLSPLGSQALAARCVHLLKGEAGLGYFAPVADFPGFPLALSATLSELRLERIPPQQLRDTGPAGPDLARLLSCYQSQLGEHRLVDWAAILEAACQILREERPALPLEVVLWLDVRPTFTLEREFWGLLAERADRVLATALEGDERSVRAWRDILKCEPEPLEEKVRLPLWERAQERKSALARVRRHLFHLEGPEPAPPDPSVEFFSAPGEGPECVEISRRLLEAASQGIPFDRMAVLLRNPELYQPLLAEAFRRAGIPAYFSRGTTRPDPSGRAFLSLLACALEGLTASRFAEYLSFAQVPAPSSPASQEENWVPPPGESLGRYPAPSFERPGQPAGDEEEGGEKILSGTLRAPFHWEKMLVDAAVVGGAERWRRRLQGLEAEYRLQLKDLQEDDPGRAYRELQLTRLQHLKEFSLPLIDYLDGLPAAALWGEWLSLLRELACRALRRPEPVLEVLSELEPMNLVGPVGLEEVHGVLSERLGLLRVEPRGRPYGSVFVGTPQESLGRDFELVFLPGLAEGLFPRRALEDPLLLDAYRRQLSPSLDCQADRIAEERMLIRMAAAAARGSLVASYPRVDVVQGRSRVPSFYALDLLRAAEGRLPRLRDLEKRAAAASQSRLGWPAPQDPLRAVDEAEFDLAFLDSLLRSPQAARRGAARFLLDANPHLARALRARALRWHSRWSPADGLVEPQLSTRQLLQGYRLSQRSYSPTSLQTFAACPYRFFLYAIQQLRLREESVSLEQMDPLTRGSLFHSVQFSLFRKLQKEGLLPVAEDNLERVMSLAEGVLQEVAAHYEEELAPALPYVWNRELEELRVDLRGWLRRLAQAGEAWRPLHFEFSFGLPPGQERDPHSRGEDAIVLNGLRLRGSIDLVEKHPQQGRLRVTDHKTGKPPRKVPRFVGEGELLQPLLYALAAEHLLRAKVACGRLFYCTQKGNYQEFEFPLTQEARQKVQQVTETIDRALARGFLPAAPRQDACAYCDYRPVCGPYEEIRISRKNRDPLAPLLEIRQLP